MPDLEEKSGETEEITAEDEETTEDSETDDSLIELKKEMAGRVVDKMQEKNGEIMLGLGKNIVVDYLVDEGGLDSVSDKVIIGKILDIFGSSMEDLTNLREDIGKAKTESELQSLEARIIEQLDKGTQDKTTNETVTSHQNSTTGSVIATGTVAGGTSTQLETTSGDYTSEGESLQDSAPVGEAKEIEKKQRMKWLFPEGIPQTEKEMKKYITKIKVPILTEKGKTKKLTLHVHKKLANEYIAIFEDMKNAGIKVNPDTTACFNWRKMRKGSKMSHHSYGTAIDVNWDVNGGVYGKTDKNSPYFNDQATVEIWKKHGFYWGGDRSAKSNDPMHFTYMNA